MLNLFKRNTEVQLRVMGTPETRVPLIVRDNVATFAKSQAVTKVVYVDGYDVARSEGVNGTIGLIATHGETHLMYVIDGTVYVNRAYSASLLSVMRNVAHTNGALLYVNSIRWKKVKGSDKVFADHLSHHIHATYMYGVFA